MSLILLLGARQKVQADQNVQNKSFFILRHDGAVVDSP